MLEVPLVDLTPSWRSLFQAWPSDLPRAGIVVMASNETIPFTDFLLGESFLILERDKPDTQGARKLIVALAAITTVKLSLPDALSRLAGFTAGAGGADVGFGGPGFSGGPGPAGGASPGSGLEGYAPSGLAARAAAAVRRSNDLGKRSP